MAKDNTLSRWLAPCLISSVGISLMLAFAPNIEECNVDNFSQQKYNTSFLNEETSSKIEAISLYDYAPIFLPTPFNKQVEIPRAEKVDSLDNMHSFEQEWDNKYTDLVLNKRESRSSKTDNIFHSSIREIMPFYKLEDKKDFLQRKDSINISVIDVKSGENIISENIKLKDLNVLSNFFVPTEVFMNISPSLDINIADNTSSSSLESSTSDLIREALENAKIFQRINSGYYKLIISP